jgi:biotin transport system permease protein
MSGPLRPPWAGPLGLYHPGTSLLHRCPPGPKLAGLALAGLVIAIARGPVSAAIAVLVAIAAQVVSHVPWHRTTRGLTGTLVTLVLAGAYQWAMRGWQVAAEVVLDIVALVLLATIVTATTRADTLLEVLARAARPLRHVGLSPETFALTCGLFLRTIPVLVQTSLEARDAARARGLENSPRAVLVPSAVRMVAHARATGDALAARGLTDD